MFLCCHSYANYLSVLYFVFFFFNDTPTTEIYTDTLFPYTTLFRSRLSSWHGSNPSAVSPKSSSTAPAPSCRCRRPRQSSPSCSRRPERKGRGSGDGVRDDPDARRSYPCDPDRQAQQAPPLGAIGRASCRERVCQYG